MVDLSFVKNPEWIAERKKCWQPIEEGLSDTFRKKEIEVIKHYFFTGELLDGFDIGDGALLGYFPLATPDGWDYVFQNLVNDPGSYERELYLFIGPNERVFTDEQQLAMWDYFLGEEYTPVVKSRVPVGASAEFVEFELSYLRVAGDILAAIATWLRMGSYGPEPKWVARKKYFYSLLACMPENCLTSPEPNSDEGRVNFLLCFIMECALNYKPKKRVKDPHKNREKFLEEFRGKLEADSTMPDCLKAKWAEVKAEQGK